MKTQKEVVYAAVVSTMGNEFKSGMDCGSWFKSHPEAKKALSESVIKSFNNNECALEKEQKSLTSYVSGLISNHLRKDTRLNGGEKYTPTNPGSRSSDPQIRAARQLLKTKEEGSVEAEKIQSFIDAKTAKIKAEKAKTAIDVENLPEELQGLVG